MKTVTHISVFSLGKVCAGICFLIGLVIGAIVSLMAATGMATGMMIPVSQMSFVLDVSAVVVNPLLAGLGGFLIGSLVAVLYNMMAVTIGGIEYGAHKADELGDVDPETLEQATGGQKNPGADY